MLAASIGIWKIRLCPLQYFNQLLLLVISYLFIFIIIF